jgi:hypothetical protein
VCWTVLAVGVISEKNISFLSKRLIKPCLKQTPS